METVDTQNSPVYPEHDDAYLAECLQNLKNKGIEIDINHTDGTQAV